MRVLNFKRRVLKNFSKKKLSHKNKKNLRQFDDKLSQFNLYICNDDMYY